MPEQDVPSPINFHDPAQVRAWEAQTIKNRPWRPQFFAAFVAALNGRYANALSVLELGSGPGHLAEAVLGGCNVAQYAALDFSPAMHELARARLGALAGKVRFVERDFRLPDWIQRLGIFDAVITMQAAHEVRHIRHLPVFLEQARRCVAPGGLFLYCDHYAEPGSSENPALMLEPQDQPVVLANAGFSGTRKLLDMGGMALYSAENSNR